MSTVLKVGQLAGKPCRSAPMQPWRLLERRVFQTAWQLVVGGRQKPWGKWFACLLAAARRFVREITVAPITRVIAVSKGFIGHISLAFT